MTIEAEPLVDRPAAHPVLRAVRRALEVTFVEPVADGRPILSRWPAGLGVVGWTTGALVVVLAAVSVFAGVLRAHFPFVSSQASNRSMPEILLPLFVAVVIWTLGLAHCALIRLAWYMKLPALAVTLSAMVTLGIFSNGRVLVIAVAALSYLAVFVIVFARRRAPYAWWEFPLVTTLVAISWLVVLLAPSVDTTLALSRIFPVPLGVSEVRPFLAFKAGSFFQLTLVHVDNNRVRLSPCLQGFPWNRDQSVTGPK